MGSGVLGRGFPVYNKGKGRREDFARYRASDGRIQEAWETCSWSTRNAVDVPVQLQRERQCCFRLEQVAKWIGKSERVLGSDRGGELTEFHATTTRGSQLVEQASSVVRTIMIGLIGFGFKSPERFREELL